MKWLFGMLLVASLAFWAVMQWGAAGLGDNPLLQAQAPLYPEKIKLLPVLPASSVAAQSSVSASAELSAQASASPATPADTTCVEWGDFSGNDVARATAALSTLQLGKNLTQRDVLHANGYWVYLPPLNTSAEIAQTVAQIKNLGLEEFYVVHEESKWKNSISLGVFKTRDAANKFRDGIRAKGLKFASVGERRSTHLTVFIIKTQVSEVMEKISNMQKDFPEAKIKTADCQQSLKAD